MGKDVAALEPSPAAGRAANWCSCYGKRFGGSSKSHTISSDPAMRRMPPKELKTVRSEHLSTQRHDSKTHSGQKVRTVQVSTTGRRMDDVVRPPNGTSPGHAKGRSTDTGYDAE